MYGVATISRLLNIIGLFCRMSSLSWGSFAKETYDFKEPTTCRHPISLYVYMHMYIYDINILYVNIRWTALHVAAAYIQIISVSIYVYMHIYIYDIHILHVNIRWTALYVAADRGHSCYTSRTCVYVYMCAYIYMYICTYIDIYIATRGRR